MLLDQKLLLRRRRAGLARGLGAPAREAESGKGNTEEGNAARLGNDPRLEDKVRERSRPGYLESARQRDQIHVRQDVHPHEKWLPVFE